MKDVYAVGVRPETNKALNEVYNYTFELFAATKDGSKAEDLGYAVLSFVRALQLNGPKTKEV